MLLQKIKAAMTPASWFEIFLPSKISRYMQNRPVMNGIILSVIEFIPVIRERR